MGRFINEDTYRGQIENPPSQNLYTYCHNNPVIYIDPSGHRVEGEGGGKSKCGSGKGDKGTGKTNTVQNYTLVLSTYVVEELKSVVDRKFPSKMKAIEKEL